MILFLQTWQTWQTFKIRPGPWIIYWIWYQNMRSRLWWWPIDHIHIIQRSSKIIFSLFTFVWTTTGSARHQQLRASSSYLRTWNQKAPNLHHLHQCAAMAMADWCQRWCLTKPQISNQPYDGMNPRWCKIPKSRRICSLCKRNTDSIINIWTLSRSNLPDNEIVQMENRVNFLQLPSSRGHLKTLPVTQTRFNGLTSKADQSLKTLTPTNLLIYLTLTLTLTSTKQRFVTEQLDAL